MNEAWDCAQCSTRNDAWRIGCSKCSAIRPDLSAATPRNDPAAAAAVPAAPADDPLEAPASEPNAAPIGDGADDLQDAPPSAPPGLDWGPYAPVAQDAAPTTLAAENAMPEAARSAPLWQRLPIGWIIFGILIFGGAIGGFIFNASRGSTGEIDRAGNLVITDLRVGDCFDLKDPTADEVEEVAAMPCAQAHQYELIHIGDMPDGAYPTDTEFTDWLDANCTPAFEAYIGEPYETSIYELFWFSPTTGGWLGGDHTIQCAVSHPTQDRVTGSLRGAGG